MEREDWDTSAKLKSRYPNTSIISGHRAVFNINGNKYRLVVGINYQKRLVYIKCIGAHAEYDRINVEEA